MRLLAFAFTIVFVWTGPKRHSTFLGPFPPLITWDSVLSLPLSTPVFFQRLYNSVHVPTSFRSVCSVLFEKG